MYLILEDILSNFKKKVYALQGEKVELISEHGETWIMQGKRERFPVNKSKVKEV